jgi:protein SCO1/2
VNAASGSSTRLIAIAGAAIVVLALAVGVYAWRSGWGGSAGSGGGTALIGGPFALVDQNGNRRRDSDFRGSFMLIYFGYSFCPDVCTTALNDMSQALDRVGPAAQKVQPIFITIDPARDTAAQLKDYATNFHPRLVALTGSPEAIAGAAKAYRVYFAKSKETANQPEYLMDHSSIIFLMDRDGRYLTHFTHATSVEAMVNAIRKHVS